LIEKTCAIPKKALEFMPMEADVDYKGTMIGIKIADGSFFPVLQDTEKKRKKVILTTVKDAQPTVQIDLYQGNGEEMTEPEYIGSLMINNISPAPRGEPEIELMMGMDDTGNLVSKARDLKGSEEKSLSVSLQSLSEEDMYSLPDFEVSETEEEASPKPAEKEDAYETPYFNAYNGSGDREPGVKNNRPLFLIAGIALLAVLLLVLVLFVLPGFKQSDRAVAAPAAQTPRQEPAPGAAKPAVQGVETVPDRPPAAGISKPESTGVWYSTVKGDNLWNLSRSFYKDPWLFKKIAEENGISNPSLIPQDHRLYIPDVETGKR
jgi:hypothetical protein